MCLSGDENSIGGKAVRELFAGVVAGGANIVSGYPFDTVKVRLQAEQGVYKGPWHCLTTILRKEGVRNEALLVVLSVVRSLLGKRKKAVAAGNILSFYHASDIWIRALVMENCSSSKSVDLKRNEFDELGASAETVFPISVDPRFNSSVRNGDNGILSCWAVEQSGSIHNESRQRGQVLSGRS